MLTDNQFEERIESIRDKIQDVDAQRHIPEHRIALAIAAVAESLLLLNEQMRAESKRPR
jgi:hypothetical protein